MIKTLIQVKFGGPVIAEVITIALTVSRFLVTGRLYVRAVLRIAPENSAIEIANTLLNENSKFTENEHFENNPLSGKFVLSLTLDYPTRNLRGVSSQMWQILY